MSTLHSLSISEANIDGDTTAFWGWRIAASHQETVVNRRDRKSMYLTEGQGFKFVATALEAFNSGRPLNYLITIQFKIAGLGPLEAQSARSHYLKLCGDWLQRVAKTELVYIYMFENERRGGLHVHILLHVPLAKRRQFRDRQPSWLKASGIPYDDQKVLDCRPIRGSTDVYPWRYLHNLRNIIGYLLKGAHPEVCAKLGINSEYQGIVVGKRTGYSQSRGRGVRPKTSPSAQKTFVQAFLDGSVPVEASNWLGEARRVTHSLAGAAEQRRTETP